MLETVQKMSLEEFLKRSAAGERIEIYDGEIKTLMPTVTIHQWVITFLVTTLYQHCMSNRLGRVFSEIAFVLQMSSDWVRGSRIPDVAFIAAARWREYTAATPDWQQKPLLIVPDLVIEVVSPNDSYTDIQNKIDHYLTDGVSLIWIIDPQRKAAEVYQGDHYASLKETDTLSGGDVIPGFSLTLSEVFKTE